ncbi:MAG TPA: glycosyltransferase family 2 protein [Solirubrobacterales bacterium]|jgi:GT2 family glycosyltransferase|nr:glycosyltransferase family 2 protein [Solirubrobacterales bacterium]
MTELAFVLARDQNWFFVELVAALREELERQGVPSSVSTEGFPEPRDDRVYVVVPPHEFVALEGPGALPSDKLLARTIFISAEQPGTVHFDDNAKLAKRAGATFDISPWGTELLRDAGIPAQQMQVGYTPRWDHFDPERERDIDILFLGCQTLRRLQYLGSFGRTFSRWRCHLQISDNSAPNPTASAGFVTDDKWDLLSRAKVLINLHQGGAPYFEWLRALDAIHCGAVLVSEHSVGVEPLSSGHHLVLGRPESLGYLAEGLLLDPPLLERIRTKTYEYVRDSLPFAPAVASLAATAEKLAERRLPSGAAVPLFTAKPPLPPPAQPAAVEPTELSALRAGVKATRLDLLSMRRQLSRLEETVRSPDRLPPPRAIWVDQTRGWLERREPTVTVLTALYNHAETIGEMLDSLAGSGYADFEVIVTDDGSNDGSGEAVSTWMREHDDLAALLVRHPVNSGLGTARNTAFDFARGRYCLILDSDNEVYPRCMPVLAAALDDNPEAAFAYPILQATGAVEAYVAGGGAPMVSLFGWDPQRLRHGNYIDALSMIRAEALREVGGYTTDGRLYGWEDYDLWCGMAEAGKRGLLVPEMLARYRTSPASMQWTTNISTTAAVAAAIERHPKLLAGVVPPQ